MSLLLLAALAPSVAPGPVAPPPAPADEAAKSEPLPSSADTADGVAEPEPVADSADTAAAPDETRAAEENAQEPTVARVADQQPLPEAPSRVDAAKLEPHAWRGQGFFQIHLAAMVPVGGKSPGRGTVASAGGGLQAGFRARPFLAAGIGLTTFLHDTGESLTTDSAGETVEVQDFGRLSLFDPFVRFFVPTRGKVEPRFDVGALLGTYRAPFSDSPQFATGARIGAGFDVWIGPGFSLDFGVDPRLIVIDGAAGITLQAGMGATVHW